MRYTASFIHKSSDDSDVPIIDSMTICILGTNTFVRYSGNRKDTNHFFNKYFPLICNYKVLTGKEWGQTSNYRKRHTKKIAYIEINGKGKPRIEFYE